MMGLTQHHHYYFHAQSTDMRKGFDGLSGIVMSELAKDPMDGSVYIFINRRRDRMKILLWESGGFLLYYKRLESGTFDYPLNELGESRISISWEDLVLILQGIQLTKVARKKRYKRA